ncbi:MAG: alpha/beta hydrolase-fold protein [Bacteroidota bacterium]
MKTILLLTFICLLNTTFGNKSIANDSIKPFVLGQTREIQSTVLNEKRILNIYLPEGYKADDTTKYSVIYLLDGSADEDFIHVAGLLQFNMFPWVNRTPKSILVGIANVDRKRDFTFPSTVEKEKQAFPTTGHSEQFITFIEKELQPFIEKNYNTNHSKTIIGQSLGGLLAIEILFKKPTLFNQYLIISPSLWWDNGSLFKYDPVKLKDSTLQTTSVYIGVGKEGAGPGDYLNTMESMANTFYEKLVMINNKKLGSHFDYMPKENHATNGHIAVYNGLLWLSTLHSTPAKN